MPNIRLIYENFNTSIETTIPLNILRIYYDFVIYNPEISFRKWTFPQEHLTHRSMMSNRLRRARLHKPRQEHCWNSHISQIN